nr:MAG TPA: lysozyme [Caudoviricetes sp.]
MKLNKDKQLRAFFSLISFSEGTDRYGSEAASYHILCGGRYIEDLSKHPGIYVKLRPGLTSSAFGRYQILEKYAKHYMKQLGLRDFGPASQDAIAKQLIRECKALDDIYEGRIRSAIYKCRSRWASFPPPPGSGKLYDQRVEDIEKMLRVFRNAGGVVTD